MTKSEEIKDVVYYMSLPYTTILRPDEEGDQVARIEELPGCVAHGQTTGEALENLREAQQLWIEDCLESGQPVPEPQPDEDLPSGKWVQRVPRTLHKRLVQLAKKEGVSLNQLVTSMLSESVAARTWKDQIGPWIEALSALSKSKSPHAYIWEGTSGCEDWRPWLTGQPKVHGSGLLTHLTAARKLISTHDERIDTYDAKAIAGYQEAAEHARRRR